MLKIACKFLTVYIVRWVCRIFRICLGLVKFSLVGGSGTFDVLVLKVSCCSLVCVKQVRFFGLRSSGSRLYEKLWCFVHVY